LLLPRWATGLFIGSLHFEQMSTAVLVILCTAQWSLYVPHSGHYIYRTVVTI